MTNKHGQTTDPIHRLLSSGLEPLALDFHQISLACTRVAGFAIASLQKISRYRQ